MVIAWSALPSHHEVRLCILLAHCRVDCISTIVVLVLPDRLVRWQSVLCCVLVRGAAHGSEEARQLVNFNLPKASAHEHEVSLRKSPWLPFSGKLRTLATLGPRNTEKLTRRAKVFECGRDWLARAAMPFASGLANWGIASVT